MWLSGRLLSSQGSAVLLLTLTLALTAGCALSTPSSHRRQTVTPSPPPYATAIPLPRGWRQTLSGFRLTDEIGAHGLVSSPTKPGRAAACLLPPSPATTAVPRFALTDDMGAYWRIVAIPDAPPTLSCAITADSVQPDTFILSDDNGFVAYVTTDAGRSWRRVTAPCHNNSVIPISLVNGTLLAGICDSGGNLFYAKLGTTSLSNLGGAWNLINIAPLGLGSNPTHSLEGYASDVQNITTIYALISTGRIGESLFVTTDGGVSWHVARSWPTSKQMELWTTGASNVYVEDLQDLGSTTAQFFYSGDGGATWHDSGLHHRDIGDPIFISPQGEVLEFVATAATSGNVFRLNPQTGDFTLLVSTMLAPSVFNLVILNGSPQTMIYTSQFESIVIPLPMN